MVVHHAVVDVIVFSCAIALQLRDHLEYVGQEEASLVVNKRVGWVVARRSRAGEFFAHILETNAPLREQSIKEESLGVLVNQLVPFEEHVGILRWVHAQCTVTAEKTLVAAQERTFCLRAESRRSCLMPVPLSWIQKASSSFSETIMLNRIHGRLALALWMSVASPDSSAALIRSKYARIAA
jgi:hypothetical protein|eukprot:6725356-Prymnesium_polylepis.1